MAEEKERKEKAKARTKEKEKVLQQTEVPRQEAHLLQQNSLLNPKLLKLLQLHNLLQRMPPG